MALQVLAYAYQHGRIYLVALVIIISLVHINSFSKFAWQAFLCRLQMSLAAVFMNDGRN